MPENLINNKLSDYQTQIWKLIVAHVFVSKLIIGSDSGLPPGRRQAII